MSQKVPSEREASGAGADTPGPAAGQPVFIQAAPRGSTRRRWLILTAVVVLLVVLGLAAHSGQMLPAPLMRLLGGAGRKGPGGPPPRLVGVVEAVTRPMPVEVSAVGTVDPLRSVAVKSRVDGQLIAVRFEPGAEVKAGQVLFQLDPRPLQAALQQAQAALGRDQATLENLKLQFNREAQLYAQKVESQQNYDQARTALESQQKIISLDGATIDNARLQLEFTTIHSPINGRAGKVLIDLGNQVKANDTSPLVTINQVQPIYVTFSAPQQYLNEIRERRHEGNLAVLISVGGGRGQRQQGKLVFIDNTVDVSTGTIQMRGLFQNEDELLWPGQFVTATLVLHTQDDAVVLPPEAVQNGKDGTYVYVVNREANNVKYTPVTVDRTVNSLSVISTGIKAGDTVVLDGQLNLMDGSRVQIAPSGTSATGKS